MDAAYRLKSGNKRLGRIFGASLKNISAKRHSSRTMTPPSLARRGERRNPYPAGLAFLSKDGATGAMMKDKLFLGLTEKQIEEHTPYIAARGVIRVLTELVDDIQANGKGQFVEQFLKFVIGYGIKARDLSKLDEAIPLFEDQPLEDFAEATNIYFIHSATVFAVDAVEEFKSGRIQHAWILALQAERYLGLALGSNPVPKIPKAVKSDAARNNAYKSHKKHRQAENEALQYYRDNISTFSSLDDAAEKIEAVKNIKFSTIRGYLTKFHKDNPSIPKPSRPTRQ